MVDQWLFELGDRTISGVLQASRLTTPAPPQLPQLTVAMQLAPQLQAVVDERSCWLDLEGVCCWSGVCASHVLRCPLVACVHVWCPDRVAAHENATSTVTACRLRCAQHTPPPPHHQKAASWSASCSFATLATSRCASPT
jgi:hypothetical protein